ncbi:MAG: Gluconolactonase [Streptosporangiaceae bacterium]|nr:Gluconolactonase [Streptosporangiaceae bacterium]
MTNRPVHVLVDGYSYFEAPRWHDGRLWVSDFYTRQVLAISLDGTAETVVNVPGQPSGLGWLPDGTLLVVSMRDHRVLRLDGDALVEHADLSAFAGGHSNDLVVDGEGRAYVGHYGFDLDALAPMRATNLVRVDPDGSVTAAAADLMFPNGLVITPEGTLIVAETAAARLTAFDIEADGALSGRRVWAAFGDPPETDDTAAEFARYAMDRSTVAPDGIALDAEGAVWAADALHHRVVRVREGGEVLEEISGGEYGVYACALGGPDGRTLFLCAAPTFAEAQASVDHRARILTCRVDVPRAGRP